MNKKGISPIVAAVLLIAFSLIIGGLMLLWTRGFVGGTTEEAEKRAEELRRCGGGIIQLSNLKYCNNSLTGDIINRGTATLGNLTLFVYLENLEVSNYPLCLVDRKVINCSVSNFSLPMNEKYKFDLSLELRPIEVRITTDCPGVIDEVKNESITFC
jgi:flagellin-like protein